jgi:hypothetical protein
MMSARSSSQDKGRLPPSFVPVDKEMMDCAAWRAASCGARLLYIHLKRRWSFKKKNNGHVHISGREAEEELGSVRDSISRWFRELQHYGFVVMTEEGCLGVDGKGKAPHWRLTESEAPGGRNGNTWMLPTKDYLKWDGTKFRDDRGAVLREKNRKQNPGPQMKARVARKSRPPLARKSRPLHSASGPQMKAISDTPPGPQMRSILRFTTLLHPCARYQLPSDPFAVSLSATALFPPLKLDSGKNRAKISSKKPRRKRESVDAPALQPADMPW